MVTSVRFTAAADDPGQVKSYFDELFRRCGLGLGQVTDEHYERAPEGLGYTGRVKVVYGVPMTAVETEDWFAGGDPVSHRDGGLFSTGLGSAEDVLDNIRRIVNVDHVEVQFPTRGQGWIVMVDFTDKPDSLRVQGETLREAALDAYGRCGTSVTEYRTTG